MKINSSYFKDKKTILTICSLTLAFALTIALSFGTRFFIKGISDTTFWGDLAISWALCIYCLFFGIPEGKNSYSKKPQGRFMLAQTNFHSIRERICKRDNEFNQWLEKYYQENKKDYYNMILSTHGNINPLVLDLDYEELPNLLHPYKKEWDKTEFSKRKTTYFRTINEEQLNIIKQIFRGKIKIEKLPDDFFKTFNGKVISSEYVVQAKTNKKNNFEYIFLIFLRLITVFIFAFVFSLFGIEMAQSGSASETLQRIITTLSRLWTMATSFVYGFSMGKLIIINSAVTLEYKARVNTLFENDNNFVAIDEERIAETEYKEYVKK